MRRQGHRKLALSLETLRRLDDRSLEEVGGRALLEADSVTCASAKRCTGCAQCVPTG